MKTENLEFTVENIAKVFNYLTQCSEMHHSRRFAIEVDGVEIVSPTKGMEHFNDFMFYSLPEVRQYAFTVYEEAPQETTRFVFYRSTARMNYDKTLAENEKLREELRWMNNELKKIRGKQHFEKPDKIKVIDAGDFLAVFVDKNSLDKALGEQQKMVDNAAALVGKAMRFFHCYENKSKRS